MRLRSALIALVLAWMTSMAGQPLRCAMDEHACCGSGEASISTGVECPAVSPAIPQLDEGERIAKAEIDAVVVENRVEPVSLAVAIVATIADAPDGSPPGGFVLRI